MPDFHTLEGTIPVAPLNLIVMESAKELGESVNNYISQFRHELYSMPENDPAFHGYVKDSYMINYNLDRFGSGEAKATIKESVRGNDVYILTDVCNYSITYKMYNYVNHKSPDDHYQDLKRVIGAITGKAKRINVIMPFLYEGRQHKRNGMESLDAAQMFKVLHDMGISNFITLFVYQICKSLSDRYSHVLRSNNAEHILQHERQNNESDARYHILLHQKCILKKKERQNNQKHKKVFRTNSDLQRKIMIGLSLFCMSIGIFFAGVQIYIKDYGYMFWVFIAWIILFGLLAYGYRDDKSAGELEYVAQPVAFGVLTLLCIAGMIAMPIFLIPGIMAGDSDDITTLITTELACGIFGFIFFYFNVKSYLTEFINHIRSKNKKSEQKQSSEDDGDL